MKMNDDDEDDDDEDDEDDDDDDDDDDDEYHRDHLGQLTPHGHVSCYSLGRRLLANPDTAPSSAITRCDNSPPI